MNGQMRGESSASQGPATINGNGKYVVAGGGGDSGMRANIEDIAI